MGASDQTQKPPLSEYRAGGLFVLAMLDTAQKTWPQVAAQLGRLGLSIADGQTPLFEFYLAILALDLQAARNLLPSVQADRISSHVFRALSVMELGPYPEEAVRDYQATWDDAVTRQQRPDERIVYMLLSRLLPADDTASRDNVLLASHLSADLVACCGWWKQVIDRHKLVP